MARWRDASEIDQAIRTLAFCGESDFLPYARFLAGWRDAIAGIEGGWGNWKEGTDVAFTLFDLVTKAALHAHEGRKMPPFAAFENAMMPIGEAAARHGLQIPEVTDPADEAPVSMARRVSDETHVPSGHQDKLWTVDISDFVGGVSFVGDVFDFDGRADGSESEEDYTHIWEWDDFGRSLWSGTRDGIGYSVVELRDCEPATVALRADGETVGFYSDAMCWIDPPHRGRGLSVDLVRGGIALLGKVPDLNLVGFSEAGLAAHEAAHRESVREAILRGDLDDSHIPSVRT